MKHALVITMAALVLGGCGILPLAGETAAPEPVHVTSPDGTISIDLPGLWHDHSEEYLEDVPDSVLSAYWSVADRFSHSTDVFATVSTMPVGGVTVPLSERQRLFDEGWLEDFDDPRTTSGTFGTDAGADGSWTLIEGKSEGDDLTLTAVVLMDSERAVKIAIEAPPGHEDEVAVLLDALPSITLAPVDEEDEAPGTIASGAYSTGEIAVDVPAAWAPLMPDDTLRDGALGVEAVYFGAWLLPWEDQAYAASALLGATARTAGSSTPEDAVAELGPVGTLTESEQGTLTVTSIEDVAPAPGITGIRMCSDVVTPDVPTGGQVCQFILESDEWSIWGSVQAIEIDPATLADFEAMLATMTIAE